MNFIMLTLLQHLPNFKLNNRSFLHDLVFNVHAWNIDLVDVLKDIFQIGLVNDEEFRLNASQIKDHIRINCANFIVFVDKDMLILVDFKLINDLCDL